MKQLQDLIKECPELGSLLDSIGLRLFILEQSQLPSWCQDEGEKPPDKDIQPEPWSRRQWDFVQQLQAQMIHLDKKCNSYIDASKKKDTYYIK